jgi:hypothetical protein
MFILRTMFLGLAGACGGNLIAGGQVAEGLGILALAGAVVTGDRMQQIQTDACIKAVRDLLKTLGR